jgi:hypothetical protein
MTDEKLEKLKQQKQQIENRIKAHQNRQAAATRKADTRKKIVLGGAYMALEKKGVEITRAAILDYIEQTARDSDKALFQTPVAAVREDATA